MPDWLVRNNKNKNNGGRQRSLVLRTGGGESLEGGLPGVVAPDARDGDAGDGSRPEKPLVVVDDFGCCSRHGVCLVVFCMGVCARWYKREDGEEKEEEMKQTPKKGRHIVEHHDWHGTDDGIRLIRLNSDEEPSPMGSVEATIPDVPSSLFESSIIELL